MSIPCSVTKRYDCNEECAENFYKTPCTRSCGMNVVNTSLNCTETYSCRIKLSESWKLSTLSSICSESQASGRAISVDCGRLSDWFQMRIWIHEALPCDHMTSPGLSVSCTCKECHYDYPWGCSLSNVYCSCKAVEDLETSPPPSTVTTSTSTVVTSSEFQPTVTNTTTAISPTSLVAGRSNKSAVTGAAAGGAVGLLLLAVLIVFAMCYRRKRRKKSKNTSSIFQHSVINRIYDAHDGSLVLPTEDNYAVPRGYDYVNPVLILTDSGESHESTVENNQTNDYDIEQNRQPDHGENYVVLIANEDARNQETAFKEFTDCEYENDPRLSQIQGAINDGNKKQEVRNYKTLSLDMTTSDSVYENSLRICQQQNGQHGRSDTTPGEDDYNTLGQDKILDRNDDQYHHTKNVQNSTSSNGQDDYDELAKPFEKRRNYLAEDDYDHCKKPSRQHDDTDDNDDYDHFD